MLALPCLARTRTDLARFTPPANHAYWNLLQFTALVKISFDIEETNLDLDGECLIRATGAVSLAD